MLNIYKLKEKSNINNKYSIKKGEYSGEMKHYPAATKEWFNSIYSYNKNTIKSLPSTDIYVTRLVKSYFNLYNVKFEKKARIEIIRLKRRRYNMKRIIVGKPEFKHTNDKVIITLFVLNQELVNLKNWIHRIKGFKFLKLFLKKTTILKKNPQYNLEKKIYLISKLYTKFLKKVKNLNLKYMNNLKYSFFKIEKFPMIYLIKKILTKIRLYIRIKKLIYLNQSKFKSIHILPLKHILQKVYGKNVEFNIVNLKRYHYNSSILTQIMAIKLKNRNNRILKVIDKILTRTHIPLTRRLQYPVKDSKISNIQNLIIKNNLNNTHFKAIPSVKVLDSKRLSNNTLSKVLFKHITEDKLNMLLKSLYPQQYIYYFSKKNIYNVINFSNNNTLYERLRKLENIVFDKMKNKVISGLRIEASGRLSKRLIASRAIFKMRQKGTIRNIDSSYKKIPSILLRGQLTSNMDFSKSKNKGRIGAFGLKGWISSI